MHQQDLPALDDLLNLVLATQALRTAWNLLKCVPADLLDRFAFILARLLSGRHALLGAALERGYFVSVLFNLALFNREFLALSVVLLQAGANVFVGGLSDHRRGPVGVRFERCRRFGRSLRIRAIRLFAKPGRKGRNRAYLLRNRRRTIGVVSLVDGARRGIRRRRGSGFLRIIGKRRFRDGLAALGARFDLGTAGVATAAAASLTGGFFLLLPLGLGFLLEERLSIGDRDLVIIRMNLGEGKKTMAISAIVDESGLERGLYAGDLGKIDIPTERPLAGGFEVKFLYAIASQNHNPGFLGMGGVDDHFVGHDKLSRHARVFATRADKAARPRRAGRLCWRWRWTETGRRTPPHQDAVQT